MRWLILPLAAILSACATPEPEVGKTGIVETQPPPDCTPPAPYGGYLFWMEDPSVAPGASVTLTPWFTPQPGVMEDVEPGCLTITDVDGPGRLLEDGRTISVNSDAADGSAVLVRGKVGAEAISGRIVVFDRSRLPIVGYWRQRPEDCPGSEPMRELVFSGDNTFSATWMPFEVYKDYWGTFTFDADTRELVLTPTGGNHVPGDAKLSATVDLSAETLDPGPGFVGSPSSGRGCDAPFRK